MFKSRVKVLFTATALFLAFSPRADAMTTLKQVQISGNSQIDLLFDGKVQKNQIRTEFFNDVIQISLTESAVYPAKISSVNGGKLVKIFAYQYAPKLVRCRLTVKGRAEDYKDRIEFISNGKQLTVRLSETALTPAAELSAETHAAADKKHIQTADQATAGVGVSSGEEASLLEHVMKSAPGASVPVRASAPVAAVVSAPASSPAEGAPQAMASLPITRNFAGKNSSNVRLAGASPLPSPWKILGKLLLVIAIFCVSAFAFKKFSKGRGMGVAAPLKQPHAHSTVTSKGGGIFKSFGRSLGGTLEDLARSAGANLGGSGKAKMVEVISNHYIGPKKSISIVRIGERTLVLGIANESINLITELDDADGGIADLDPRVFTAALATPPKTHQFADLLRTEANRPAAAAPQTSAFKPTPTDPVFAMGAMGATAVPRATAQAYSNAQAAAFSAPTASTGAGGAVSSQIRNRLEGLKQL